MPVWTMEPGTGNTMKFSTSIRDSGLYRDPLGNPLNEHSLFVYSLALAPSSNPPPPHPAPVRYKESLSSRPALLWPSRQPALAARRVLCRCGMCQKSTGRSITVESIFRWLWVSIFFFLFFFLDPLPFSRDEARVERSLNSMISRTQKKKRVC